MFRKQPFQLPALNLQKEEKNKTVRLKEIKALVDKGTVEQITLREFREEPKKSYIVKSKEDDDDEYDTYEMFHYHIAELENKRRNKHSTKDSPLQVQVRRRRNLLRKIFQNFACLKD